MLYYWTEKSILNGWILPPYEEICWNVSSLFKVNAYVS